MNGHRSKRLLLGVACVWLCPTTAVAETPGHWSVGVERLFGINHTWGTTDTGAERPATTSVGLGLAYLEHPGYDTARIGADYLFELGLTLGTALAYASYDLENEDEQLRESYWVLEPRAGWLLHARQDVAVWPRAGLTLLMPGRESGGDHAALTFELPVIWFLPDLPVGLSAIPHLDLGFSPGRDALFGLVSTSDEVSEIGLSFGALVFF